MKEKWQHLSQRDRKTIMIGLFVTAFILAYYLFYRPLVLSITTLKTSVAEEKSLLTWMDPAAKQIQSLRKEQVVNLSTTQESLLALIEQSLNKAQLNKFANEVSQTERNKVRIKLDAVSFDAVMDWL